MSHRDIDTAFVVFHVTNPDFLEEILKIARHAKARGKTRISMRLIFEVIRFRRTLAIQGPGEYLVNNSFTSYYARLVKQQDPELGQLFETREAKTKVGGMIQEADDYNDLYSNMA
jgi:hypothetical protein